MVTISPEEKHISIARRLIISLSLMAVVLFLVGLAVTWKVVNAHVLAALQKDLKTRAEGIISQSEQGREGIQVDFFEELMPEYGRPVEPYYLQVWAWVDGAAKAVALRSPSLQTKNLPLPEQLSAEPVFFWDVLPDGRRGYLLARLFTPEVEESEMDFATDAVIVVASGLEETERARRTLLLTNITPLVVFFAALLWGIVFFVRRGLRPLNQLAEEVTHIDVYKLDKLIDTRNRPQEVFPLIKQLNTLLEHLRRAMEKERRFSSNVAHELRTPIAEIRLMSEITMRGAKEGEAEAYAEILDAAEEMETIVETLLTIARIEADPENIVKEPCSLQVLATALLKRYQPNIEKRRLTFKTNLPRMLVVTDRSKLELVLGNLISNIVKYAPEGSECAINAYQAKDGTITVDMSNPAPELERNDVNKLFERFWQKDSSRSRKDSTGLGLSLVQSLCSHLGLSISADLDEKAHILTMTVCGLKTA